MADSNGKIARGVVLATIAVVVAFLLIQLWVWTAQFSWSSDSWLLAIPVVIIAGGVGSLIALVVLLVAQYGFQSEMDDN